MLFTALRFTLSFFFCPWSNRFILILIQLRALLCLNFVFPDHLNSFFQDKITSRSGKPLLSTFLEGLSISKIRILRYSDWCINESCILQVYVKMCPCWSNNDWFLYQICALGETSFMNFFGHSIIQKAVVRWERRERERLPTFLGKSSHQSKLTFLWKTAR